MVKICQSVYPKSSEESYLEYYNKYSYPLHNFQKFAIEGIVSGNHVLVCAPTGSGKTLPGEFALDYFASKGKKTIYTTPVKALSNQKFYDFTQKYPHISVGLITGDIKVNPDAQVIIMTTEVLLNKLYQINSTTPNIPSSVSFEMDFENELGCVVFDEVHMIGDSARGHVWEQSILMLPPNVQMVMLSATLDCPEKFALWCENRIKSDKIVYLTGTNRRAVPLTHYSFITVNSGIYKAIKDKEKKEEIAAFVNKPFIIQSSKGEFNEQQYHKMNNMLKLFENNNVYVKRQHVLNQVTKYLVENEMLPALCFVLSRKQLEICANELTTVLLEDDSKVPYIIRKECDNILRKLPNYTEYLNLPEYIHLISLLEKGIGIHHAGTMPVLREMVELLFAKGYIKILFCTETMAIGINMPVKTAIFTDVNKFDGNETRILHAHEYTQMAGRAGRLGLDTVGHVIHLNNLFRNVSMLEYKVMMNGKAQTLVSKFKISYNLLLNLISIGINDFSSFAKKSMIQNEIDSETNQLYNEMSGLSKELENYLDVIANLRSPKHVVENYIDLLEKRSTAINKKRKEYDRKIQDITENYVFIENDKSIFKKYMSKLSDMISVEDKIKEAQNILDHNVKLILGILKNDNFIEDVEGQYKLTIKGTIASSLKEIHCLVFGKYIENSELNKLSTKQLIAVFSCFTNISVSYDYKDNTPSTSDKKLKTIIQDINFDYQNYLTNEMKNMIATGTDYNIHYDLINYVLKWCECNTEHECKGLLKVLEEEKGIFLGEFVKAILKINNISSEMEKVSEMLGNIEFLNKLREIPTLTLKYVVTNQSLYV
jgi:superfamily II RNA helicase